MQKRSVLDCFFSKCFCPLMQFFLNICHLRTPNRNRGNKDLEVNAKIGITFHFLFDVN